MFDELKDIKNTPSELKKFGLTIGIAFMVLALIVLGLGRSGSPRYLSLIGSILVALGLIAPKLLLPVHKVWMGAGIMIGFVVTRVIVGLLFYLVTTPLGLIARLSGKRFIDFDFKNKERASYWETRGEKHDPRSIEKQF